MTNWNAISDVLKREIARFEGLKDASTAIDQIASMASAHAEVSAAHAALTVQIEEHKGLLESIKDEITKLRAEGKAEWDKIVSSAMAEAEMLKSRGGDILRAAKSQAEAVIAGVQTEGEAVKARLAGEADLARAKIAELQSSIKDLTVQHVAVTEKVIAARGQLDAVKTALGQATAAVSPVAVADPVVEVKE